MRKAFVVLHRYAGLAMVVFMVLVALTGSLLAFTTQIERVIAPQLFASSRSGPSLDAATLIERLQNIDARLQIVGVDLKDEDRARLFFVPRVDPATSKGFALDFTEIFVNPYTGAELARRQYGDLSQGLMNLMPFVRILHGDLLARGPGTRFLGWIAVLWTLDVSLRSTSRFHAGTRRRHQERDQAGSRAGECRGW